MTKLTFKIGEEYQLKPGLGIAERFEQLSDLTNPLLKNVYIFAGVILFFLLIGGGFTVIVGAGQDNPESAAKGKKAITAALVGFLIIFTSYWILQIIDAITGLDILGGGGI